MPLIRLINYLVVASLLMIGIVLIIDGDARLVGILLVSFAVVWLLIGITRRAGRTSG